MCEFSNTVLSVRKMWGSGNRENQKFTAIAQAGWEQVPNGETKVIEGYRVTKDRRGKMVLVSEISRHHSGQTDIMVVAYPKPEDTPIFRRAGHSVNHLGPSEVYPGAIGGLGASKSGEGDSLVLGHAQQYSIQRDWKPTMNARETKAPETPKEREASGMGITRRMELAKEFGLPKAQYRRYSNWWDHAVDEWMDVAAENGWKLALTKYVLHRPYPSEREGPRRVMRLRQAVINCAKKRGMGFGKGKQGRTIISIRSVPKR